ncbi:RIKEN cDNA 4833436C18, partial [Mus musculus]
IPGLSGENPHYIPGYTGHCPLLRFSMGQTYGQVTGQLLRGPPGLAWPPAHRTLLPPIQSPRSPVISKGRLPPRRGHERLSSSIIPGYTGFIPRAQFIFAKNCNQVWAEAMSEFTRRHGEQESHQLPDGAKGEREVEEDQLREAEEPPLKQELAHASPYSMDDTDPHKFFMSGERKWVATKGEGRPQDVLTQHLPHPQVSRAMCPVPASSLAPASLCLPTRHCRNLGRCAHGAGRTRTPNLSPHFPGPRFRIWVSYLTTEATCQVRRAREGLRELRCVCGWGVLWQRELTDTERCPTLGFSFREETLRQFSGELGADFKGQFGGSTQLAFSCLWLYTCQTLGHAGYKFQFGGTFGHLTHDALGLSITQKQLPA